VRQRNGQLVTRVVNDTLQSENVEVTYGWYRLDGKAREIKTTRLRIGANAMGQIAQAKLEAPGHNPKDWVYAATLSGPGIQDQSIWKLTTYREMNIPKGALKVEVKDGNLTVTSTTFACGVHVPEESGIQLSDDYFDLLPGIPHTVRITNPSGKGALSLMASMPSR